MSASHVRRIALVTPHPWHEPHPTNDHVAELAEGLHQLHARDPESPQVLVVAPSGDPQGRRRTRRALRDLARGGAATTVLGAPELDAPEPGGSPDGPRFGWPLLALPIARGPASVSLRSALRVVLDRCELDLLHLHDPLDGELTRIAARRWPGLTLATFHAAPAPAVLPLISTPVRERILDAIDSWLVPAEGEVSELLAATLGKVPERHAVPTVGESAALHTAAEVAQDEESQARVIVARSPEDEALVRDFVRHAREWLERESAVEVVAVGRWGRHHRPVTPRWLKGRLHAVYPASRTESDLLMRGARAFVAMPGLPARAVAEARALGVPVIEVEAGAVTAAVAQLAALSADPAAATTPRVTAVDIASAVLERVEHLRGQRHVHIPGPTSGDRTCVIDLHMHTNHSWDCATDPEALLYAARKVGLTAIAVTDHDEISGALAVAELADEYGIQVIVGEEVKTSQGEVIGLFLNERIEPGLTWQETIAKIREQDGLVYVPHPFDRLHTIPDVHTLRESLDEIDAFETYNSRLTFEQYNRDAERFARKYNLIEGAGSDAHVPQGLGTAAVHMPAWDDPESFLVALRQGEIIKRPKSLLYLQGLKRVAQIAGRAGTGKPADDDESAVAGDVEG